MIPAAGLGTRMFPASKAIPKELFPLVDRPMIDYIVEEAILSGIEQIFIVISPWKKTIVEHFNLTYQIRGLSERQLVTEELLNWQSLMDTANISFVVQEEPLGLGDAILQAKDLIGSEPFAVLLPDDIVLGSPPATSQLVEVAREFGSSVIGVTELDGPEISLYGVITPRKCDHNTFQVLSLVEKPSSNEAPSNLAIVGRYILTPTIFGELESLKAGNVSEIQLTDALNNMLLHESIYACSLKGMRLDAGNLLGFLTSSIKLGLHDPRIGVPLKQWIKREFDEGNLLDENPGS